MTVLYNCRHDGDQYRITKFNDGEVESSYLTTHDLCDCPAGHRHSCRHRQMLPSMLLHGIVDTHWFLDWDGAGYPVDLLGTPKATIDALIAPLVCAPAEQDTSSIAPVPAGLTAELSPNLLIDELSYTEASQVRTSLPPASWRRL